MKRLDQLINVSFILLILNASPNQILARSVQDYKEEFDSQLEILEESMQTDDIKGICSSTFRAGRLIKKNSSGFKALEPYHNWGEMKQVLLMIYKDLCEE